MPHLASCLWRWARAASVTYRCSEAKLLSARSEDNETPSKQAESTPNSRGINLLKMDALALEVGYGRLASGGDSFTKTGLIRRQRAAVELGIIVPSRFTSGIIYWHAPLKICAICFTEKVATGEIHPDGRLIRGVVRKSRSVEIDPAGMRPPLDSPWLTANAPWRQLLWSSIQQRGYLRICRKLSALRARIAGRAGNAPLLDTLPKRIRDGRRPAFRSEKALSAFCKSAMTPIRDLAKVSQKRLRMSSRDA